MMTVPGSSSPMKLSILEEYALAGRLLAWIPQGVTSFPLSAGGMKGSTAQAEPKGTLLTSRLRSGVG